jgi:hypothetical protein
VVEDGKINEMATNLLANSYKNVEISKVQLKDKPSEAYISIVDEYRAYSPQREEVKIEALEKENGKIVGQLQYRYEHTEGEKPKEDLKKDGTLERIAVNNKEVDESEIVNYLKGRDIVIVEKKEYNFWTKALTNIHEEIELKASGNTLKWVDNDTEIDKVFGTKFKEKGFIKNITKEQLDKIKIVEDYLIAKGMPIIATDAVLKIALSQPLQTDNPRVKEFAKELSEVISKSRILKNDEIIGKVVENLKGVNRGIEKGQSQAQKREVKKGMDLSP